MSVAEAHVALWSRKGDVARISHFSNVQNIHCTFSPFTSVRIHVRKCMESLHCDFGLDHRARCLSFKDSPESTREGTWIRDRSKVLCGRRTTLIILNRIERLFEIVLGRNRTSFGSNVTRRALFDDIEMGSH